MKPQNNKNVILGSILLVVGLIFLATEFRIIDFNLFQAFFENHLWLVALGVFMILKTKPNVVFGITFAVIGLLFYSSQMGYIQYVYWNNVWPLFLVAAGFNIILKRRMKVVNV